MDSPEFRLPRVPEIRALILLPVFVYTMLGIPRELFTPIFAISRMAGWSAHRLEELVNAGKIIRPAYRYVGHHRPYLEVEDREEQNPFTEEYQRKYKIKSIKNA